MPDQAELDDVKEQLELYGSWLQSRTEVGLSPYAGRQSSGSRPLDADVKPPTVIGARQGDDLAPERSVGARMLTAAAGLAVIVGGLGFAITATGGDGDQPVTAAGEGDLSGEAAGPVGSDSDAGGDSADADDVLDVDVSEESDTAKMGDGVTDMNGDDQAGFEASTDGSDADQASATAEQASDSSDAESAGNKPATSDSSTTTAPSTTVPGDPAPDLAKMAFLSPRHGGVMDSNLGGVIRVNPMDGAASYAFTVTQNGATVTSATVTDSSLSMPSRLAGGKNYEAGVMTVTVSAMDANGTEIGTGSIQVIMQPGGGAPRYGS